MEFDVLNEHYQGYECMLERNKFMVDNSSLFNCSI